MKKNGMAAKEHFATCRAGFPLYFVPTLTVKVRRLIDYLRYMIQLLVLVWRRGRA
jgi:uncharacterized membrane protein YhaH (DUF805 family)